MWFDVEITVPASTAETSPVVTRLPVSRGVITRVSYRPRDGHLWLCHSQIRYQNTQIFPTNPEGDLHGDYFPIEWNEFIELDAEPYELVIYSWNEDDTYEHVFDFSVAITPRAAITAIAIVEAIGNLFRILSPRRIFGGS